jgi:hypothetical protein
MAKERKPKHELEAIILAEVRQTKECEGVTAVAVRGIVENGINTWEVSNTFGDRTPLANTPSIGSLLA